MKQTNIKTHDLRTQTLVTATKSFITCYAGSQKRVKSN